jgi:hypothetical protein
MGKREVASFAVWEHFSLFLLFSQESMIGSRTAPFGQNLPETPPDLHSRGAASGGVGFLGCARQGLATAHDTMVRSKGRGILGKTKNGVCEICELRAG